jgi:hypothetical protein
MGRGEMGQLRQVRGPGLVCGYCATQYVRGPMPSAGAMGIIKFVNFLL